jgi:hypothetical protein
MSQRTVCYVTFSVLNYLFGLSMYLTGNWRMINSVTPAFIYGATHLLQGLPLYSHTSCSLCRCLFLYYHSNPNSTFICRSAAIWFYCLVLYAVCSALSLSLVSTSEWKQGLLISKTISLSRTHTSQITVISLVTMVPCQPGLEYEVWVDSL